MVMVRMTGRPVRTRGTFPLVFGVLMSGCASSSDTQVAKSLKALGGAPLEASVHLGIPLAENNENTQKIISTGQTAIPLLTRALSSGNPKTVGYSAFCLRQLHAASGLEVAEQQ